MSYSKHEVYKCDLCKLEAVFDSEEGVLQHLKGCMMNPENRFPMTSKHTVLKVYPFNKEFRKEWSTDNAFFEFTPFVRPYCTKRGRDMAEEELYLEDEYWESREGESIPIVETDEYIEFMEMLDAIEDVEIIGEVKNYVKGLKEE